MVTPPAYFDLLEALSEPGCAICRLTQRATERSLSALLYEYANTPDMHRAFRAARGLCNEHSWQLTQHRGRVLNVAILYRATVDEVLKILDQTPVEAGTWWTRLRNPDKAAAQLADRLEPTEPCVACTLMAESENSYLWALAEYIADERLKTAYRSSDGVCLPHFRQVLRQTQNADQLQGFVTMQSAIWHKLKADLELFVDKNDHSRMSEAMGVEKDSWLRAIRQIAGEKGLFGIARRFLNLP